LLNVGDLDSEINAVLEVVIILSFCNPHYIGSLTSFLAKAKMTCSIKGLFPTGSITLDLVWVSGLHLRPSPAAKMTAFKLITAKITRMGFKAELALYLFGPWLIKIMNECILIKWLCPDISPSFYREHDILHHSAR
jgi:hypothetical protein